MRGQAALEAAERDASVAALAYATELAREREARQEAEAACEAAEAQAQLARDIAAEQAQATAHAIQRAEVHCVDVFHTVGNYVCTKHSLLSLEWCCWRANFGAFSGIHAKGVIILKYLFLGPGRVHRTWCFHV